MKVLNTMSLLKIKKKGESRFHELPTISQRFLLFFNGEEFRKVQWINRKWNSMQNYVVINFL